jgi:hypothetical protein
MISECQKNKQTFEMLYEYHIDEYSCKHIVSHDRLMCTWYDLTRWVVKKDKGNPIWWIKSV